MSPCAAMLCGPNTTTVEENGQGVYKPATACVKTGFSGADLRRAGARRHVQLAPRIRVLPNGRLREVGANGQCGFRQTALTAYLSNPPGVTRSSRSSPRTRSGGGGSDVPSSTSARGP
ncbi:MAG: hypothetical protein IPG50_11835 [Myxococcales bacterium]|nr:hypothetical protein [Myxococcales bacterium]